MGMRPREIHLLILTIDLVILTLSFFLVRSFLHAVSFENVKPLMGILIISYVLISPIFVEDLRNFKIEFLKMTKSLVKRFVYYFALASLILICCEKSNIPRIQFLATIVVFFLIKFCVSLWYFFQYSFKTHLYLKPTVIIGNNRLGNHLHNYFLTNKHLGILPIGIIAESSNDHDTRSVIGVVDDFQQLFDHHHFEDVFIVLPLPKEELITNLIALAERNGVRTHLVPNYVAKQKIFFKTGNIGNVPLLQVHSFPLDIYSNRFQKRAFDILFATVTVILLLPVGLLIAIAIKLMSKGPVFFEASRLGVTGMPFKLYKFRTMKYDPTGTSHTRSTVLNDDRITPIGKFLRKFSLDELPQFLNVLNNDMSVVGPRPHRINLNKDLQQKMGNYMMRHTIKPGITGWAQVNGWRGPTDTKIQYWGRTLHDLWYIENWNLGLDIYIIIMTVFGRKSRKNAF
jgi:putative colanic acid biosysnthesis UDP-glucose lipid carrier transferase